MKNNLLSVHNLSLTAMILVVAVVRILTNLYPEYAVWLNFTPIGAMALFGGAVFTTIPAFSLPILALYISDVVLNALVFHTDTIWFYPGFYWTYGAFALMVLVGRWLKPTQGVFNFIGGVLMVTFIHWIVTDLGVFLETAMYPKTVEGWMMCLAAAIPFERVFLAGTFIYGTFLFGGYYILTHPNVALAYKKA